MNGTLAASVSGGDDVRVFHGLGIDLADDRAGAAPRMPLGALRTVAGLRPRLHLAGDEQQAVGRPADAVDSGNSELKSRPRLTGVWPREMRMK